MRKLTRLAFIISYIYKCAMQDITFKLDVGSNTRNYEGIIILYFIFCCKLKLFYSFKSLLFLAYGHLIFKDYFNENVLRFLKIFYLILISYFLDLISRYECKGW